MDHEIFLFLIKEGNWDHALRNTENLPTYIKVLIWLDQH